MKVCFETAPWVWAVEVWRGVGHHSHVITGLGFSLEGLGRFGYCGGAFGLPQRGLTLKDTHQPPVTILLLAT